MIPKELFKKIRQIEITTNRMVTDIFAGQYHSVFKGQGMEFDEVREYQFGDDVRNIDWNVTARVGRPHIKKYVEEREMNVMILVDASMSCKFGTVNQLKSEIAAEIAAVLAYSAIRNNDKVGLIIFTDQIEKYIPPNKGLRHVLRIVREVLYFKPKGAKTKISTVLDYLNRAANRRSVCFLISDFFDAEENLKRSMALTNKRHDLVAITLNDPKEAQIENCGMILLEDAESNETLIFDSGDYLAKNSFKQNSDERIKNRKSLFGSISVDHIDISTDKPYHVELVKFFKLRKRRFARV